MEGLGNDAELLGLTSRACAEGVVLARNIGRPDPPVMFGPLIARPVVINTIVAGLKRFNPEVLFYIDHHFGKKLLAQNRIMAREMSRLAGVKQVPHWAIDELALRLDEARAHESSDSP